MNIDSILYSMNPIPPIDAVRSTGTTRLRQGDIISGEGNRFAMMLQDAMNEISRVQTVSDQMTAAMLLGSVDVHQATIAMDKAVLTLRTFIAVRDRMLEAYQEISRMQV